MKIPSPEREPRQTWGQSTGLSRMYEESNDRLRASLAAMRAANTETAQDVAA